MLCLLLLLLGTWGLFITSYTSMQWQLAHSYNGGERWYCNRYNLSVSKCHIIIIFWDLSSQDKKKVKGYDFTKYAPYNALYSLRYTGRRGKFIPLKFTVLTAETVFLITLKVASYIWAPILESKDFLKFLWLGIVL